MADYSLFIVAHAGALGLILFASASLGRVFLRRYRFHSFVEQAVFTLALGLGLWALLFFCLGLLGILYREVILALTAAGVMSFLLPLARRYKSSGLPDLRQWWTLSRPRKSLIVLIVLTGLFYWAILFQLPQYPPAFWDATGFHLALAKEYLAQHRIVPHEGLVFPVTLALNHVLFTWALAIKDGVLAQMIEHLFMIFVALALYAWGKRRDQPGLGLAVAAFWLGTPLVISLGALAFVDMGNACYGFLGIYALRVFWDSREDKWWYLGTTLIAIAAGIKLPGLFFVVIAFAFGLWAYVRSQLTGRALIRGGMLTFLVVAPWYAFVGYITGNPFWPGFTRLSRGVWRLGADAFWLTWGNVGVPKTLLNFLLLPVQMVFKPDVFVSFDNRHLLPIVIAFPLAWVISLLDRSVRWWTLWALAYTGFWFYGSQQLRFWVPALPLVGLAIYESISWLMKRVGEDAILQSVVWTALAVFALQVGVRSTLIDIRIREWPPPHTLEARERFLERFLEGYAGVEYINRHARGDDVVFSINASWLNYYYRPKAIDTSGLLQLSARPAFHWPEDEPWVRQLESRNIKWVLVNYTNPQSVLVPKQDPTRDPFWPDYELVYADSMTWVFRQKPIPPENR
ncbi:MAG TPA: hypothetical protein VHE60_04665 [Pyrinomonadaceae bacterium]|nr:hypothetical protein [Pyrinomonadaceae bacterium]